MAERMFSWEYRPGEELVLHFRPLKYKALPASTREHILAAQKEMLLAVRGLLDGAIEWVERTEKAQKKTRTKIEVQ